LDLLVQLRQEFAFLHRLAGQFLEADHDAARLRLELDLLERLDLAGRGDVEDHVAALDLGALGLELLVAVGRLGLPEVPPGAAGQRDSRKDDRDLHVERIIPVNASSPVPAPKRPSANTREPAGNRERKGTRTV